MDNDFAFLYDNMRYLRRLQGLTQREMAKILHISVGSVRRLEKGEMPPRLGINFVWYISSHFGVSPGELFGRPLF